MGECLSPTATERNRLAPASPQAEETARTLAAVKMGDPIVRFPVERLCVSVSMPETLNNRS